MGKLDINTEAFFSLLRAGLWESGDKAGMPDAGADYSEVFRIAKEQSVVGLVAAGLESLPSGNSPSKAAVLPFMGTVLQLERRNLAMNAFIATLAAKLKDAGIVSVLVKGQGVARCYRRPLWMSCGDVDLLLDADGYRRAFDLLRPAASSVDDEDDSRLHVALTIDSWVVELHGTLHTRQLIRLNGLLDKVQCEVFDGGKMRIWEQEGEKVLLPAPDEDVVFVFAHILQHYYGGGIGLRQVCDWSRLIYTFGKDIDSAVLENRLREAGIMTEWKAFAALAADFLGMDSAAIPFYSAEKKWSRKARRIISYILETGNFGYNRDNSFRRKSFLVRSVVSFWRYTVDSAGHLLVFPRNTISVWFRMVWNGIRTIRLFQ